MAGMLIFPFVVAWVHGFPADAQNVTCTTRPPGDNSNACASTAFVDTAIAGISFPSLPLSIVNGGTGTSTPNLSAGANITITGMWPNQTIAASGGSTGSGTVASGTQGQIAIYASNGTTVSGAPACTPIEAFGGAGDNSTDNSTALSGALSSLSSTGGCIGFSGGIYKFNSAVSYTYPSTGFYNVTLSGSGPGSTQLLWPSTNGISFSLPLATQSFVVKNLAFITGSTNHTALNITDSIHQANVTQSSVENVTFAGQDLNGLNNDYWGYGVNIVNLSDVNFAGITVYGSYSGGSGNEKGVGIQAGSNGSVGQLAYFYNVTRSVFIYVAYGVVMGNHTQGVTVAASQFVNCGSGIIVPGTQADNSLLVSRDSQYNCDHSQIVIFSNIASVIATGNIFYVTPNWSGIDFNTAVGSQDHSITNNVFNCLVSGCTGGSGATGISMLGTPVANVINSNVFDNLGYGVKLSAGATYTTVAYNTFRGVTNSVSNLGGAACPASSSGNCISP